MNDAVPGLGAGFNINRPVLLYLILDRMKLSGAWRGLAPARYLWP